jgi:hypothetical protein
MRGREGRRRKNQGKRDVGIMRQQQIQDPRSKIQDPHIQQLNNGNQEWGTTRKKESDDKWHNHNADEPGNKN